MGSIHLRGTRTSPRYYLSFKTGTKSDARAAYVMRAAKGCLNKSDARRELARIESAIARGEPWEFEEVVSDDVGDLIETWCSGLTNRAAYEDQLVSRRDLVSEFRGLKLSQLTLPRLLDWLQRLSGTTMAPQTQRHRLTLLSRFFSWAIERELTDTNPCLMVPRGRRPAAKRVTEPKWLDDDARVPELMGLLGDDVGLMFYLARFSGMREGEAAGLRLSDLDWIGEGTIRVQHSFGGPLKESKNGSKPVKWVPSPSDAESVLGPHLQRRLDVGAGPDDLLFPYEHPKKGRARVTAWKEWAGYHPRQIRDRWRAACDALALPKDLTFYGASRHTFTTKALRAGNALDEVSAALGHADPATTHRYYSHYVRRTFSDGLRQGLAATAAARTDGSAAVARRGGRG